MEPKLRAGGKWLSGSALLCLALAGCNKAPQETQPVTGAPVAALQLATAPPPPPAYAPPASSLPAAPKTVAYRPTPEHWRYLTDAYDMSDAFADTPPDYTVDYEGENPYVWRADDGAYRMVEWLPDGARYYYYEPGADEPFLIQDPEYSYAYDNGVLVAVYTLAGALVADRIAAERRDYAARYYARGHDLYRAAAHDQRRAAYAERWRERAPAIQAQRDRWQRGREEQAGWRDWNRAHQAQQEVRWAPERRHRQAYAAALQERRTAQRGQGPAQRTAEARPQPHPHAEADRGALHNEDRRDHAERRAEAQHEPQPPRQQQNQQRPAWIAAARVEHHGRQQQAPQPRTLPQQRVAERQAMAHAHAAQQQQQQQQQQQRQQHHAVQQARQAQQREAQQAREAEQQQAQQARQAQHAQAQRAQHAQAEAERQQHARVQQLQQKPTPTPHAAPPQAPHSASEQHAAPSHPQPPHPIPQAQGPQRDDHKGRDRKDDRHPH